MAAASLRLLVLIGLLWLQSSSARRDISPFSWISHNRRSLQEREEHRSHRWTSDVGKFTFSMRDGRRRLEGLNHREGPLRRDVLGKEIRRENLKALHLDYFKVNDNPERMETLNCKGGTWPAFEVCPGNFSWIQASWREELSDNESLDALAPANCPLLRPQEERGVIPEFDKSCSIVQDYFKFEKTGGQLFAVPSVYINSRGNLLNSEFHFDRGGCANDREKYVYPEDTPVRYFKEVLNLAHWNAHAFYHGVVEILPAVLLVSDILRRNPNIPVAHREDQHVFLEGVGLTLLGIRADQLNIHSILDTELLYADIVYQPFYAPCSRPSPNQWRYLRSHFLLPPDGIPMFNSDWTERLPAVIQTDNDENFAPDWIAVLAKRYGGRSLVQTDEVENAMVELFGRERVKIFDGSVSILEAKDLFNQARIFVAGHGAAMTNMFFMPRNSFVFEIRPNLYWEACFHHLAEASGHTYYLSLGEGTKETALNANMTDVLSVLNTIAQSVRRFVTS